MERIKYIKPQLKEFRMEPNVILAGSSYTMERKDIYTDINNDGNDFSEND